MYAPAPCSRAAGARARIVRWADRRRGAHRHRVVGSVWAQAVQLIGRGARHFRDRVDAHSTPAVD